jgi:thioredoxin 1
MIHKSRKSTGTVVGLAAFTVTAGISLGAASNLGSVPKSAEVENRIVTTQAVQADTPAAAKQRGKVYYADEANFAELVLNSDVPVLVDFYADWCGPCRMLAPVLEKLARETEDAKIVKVNIDEGPQLAARYKITSIPSLKVFESGEVVEEHVGLASKAELKEMLGI